MTLHAKTRAPWVLTTALVIVLSAVLANAQNSAGKRRVAASSTATEQTTAVASRHPCRVAAESSECLQARITSLEGQLRELQDRLNAVSSGGAAGQVPAGLESRLNLLETRINDLVKLIGDPGKADKFEDIWTAISRIEKRLNELR